MVLYGLVLNISLAGLGITLGITLGIILYNCNPVEVYLVTFKLISVEQDAGVHCHSPAKEKKQSNLQYMKFYHIVMNWTYDCDMYFQDHYHGCLYDGPEKVSTGWAKLHTRDRELWVIPSFILSLLIILFCHLLILYVVWLVRAVSICTLTQCHSLSFF